MSRWFQRLGALSALALLAACGGSDDLAAPAPGTVVQVAQGDARFSTLVEAVAAADLATTLAGSGPLTVFAPTNDSVSSGLAITDERARSARITATDVLASNGVIHVIDKVILPRP